MASQKPRKKCHQEAQYYEDREVFIDCSDMEVTSDFSEDHFRRVMGGKGGGLDGEKNRRKWK